MTMLSEGQCPFCGGFSFAYAPSGRARCTICAEPKPGQTEFSAYFDMQEFGEYYVIRAENGAAGFTSHWTVEQIEDYGLADICALVESAMWRSYRTLRKAMAKSA